MQNLMSDVGGLLSSLTSIGMLVVTWVADYWLNDFLIRNLLYQRIKNVKVDTN